MLPFKFRKLISMNEKMFMVHSDNVEDQKYFSFQEHPNAIMICTGLYDRNRNPVYAEDIVKIGEQLYLVHWDFPHARFVLMQNKVIFENFSEMIKICEVIGNFPEHPELFFEQKYPLF